MPDSRIVVDGAALYDTPEPKPEPSTTEPAMEPELAAATAKVEAVVDDGIVTAEEAREAADEAAKVLSAAAHETPDSPEPERAYDSDGEIARLVMELCDDPKEMRKDAGAGAGLALRRPA